jgi:hypothetical protein
MSNEKTLGDKLAEHSSAKTSVGLPEKAAREIKRARRLAGVLGGMTIGLWSLVALGAASYCYCFVTYVVPIWRYWATTDPKFGDELTKALLEEIGLLAQTTLIGTYVWAGLIILAATSTVLYVMASRRATLRQIHNSLAEISEQLRAFSQV